MWDIRTQRAGGGAVWLLEGREVQSALLRRREQLLSHQWKEWEERVDRTRSGKSSAVAPVSRRGFYEC